MQQDLALLGELERGPCSHWPKSGQATVILSSGQMAAWFLPEAPQRPQQETEGSRPAADRFDAA